MPENPAEIPSTSRQPSLGDRIRTVADQLKEETDLQIKATSRILGAAAQIAEHHDQLIDEVTQMVEQDLAQQEQAQPRSPFYTEATLKQRFKTFIQAKAHFGVKANSWKALVDKLNEASVTPQDVQPSNAIHQRLNAIEQEVKALRSEMAQVLTIADEILALLKR